ncbi:MAG TPA: Uma2 family endonuclease [Chloroflexota bacterium]|nr:Uma2 family endonuclease [Chloroflexota bacterium]
MTLAPWRQPPLTKEQEDDLFMLLLENDEEDAPWMVMGDLQYWSASSLAHSLHNYALEQHLGWYVASMLPIYYPWPNVEEKKFLSPDLFVAFVDSHPRTSFDIEEEGGFPPFVLEVASASSTVRDLRIKRQAYDLLGVREYVVFLPREERPSTLEGYRRGTTGALEEWPVDEHGRLWSAVLNLYFEVHEQKVQARTAEGRLLLTPRQEAEARRHAEDEVERLRRELQRYQRRDNGSVG